MSGAGGSRPAWLLMQQRLRSGWASSRAKRALSWWAEQLLACLPSSLRHRLQALSAENNLPWPLAASTQASQAKPVYLVLPASEVLACAISLPWKAVHDLRSVVGFELDKYTPFTPEQVHFDVQAEPLIKDQPIRVTVWLIERKRLAAILEPVQAQGWITSRVDVSGQTGKPQGINLLPPDAHSARRRALLRLKLRACVLGTILAVGLGLSVLANREAQLEWMQQEVKTLRGKAQQVEAMRQKVQARKEVEATLRRSAPGEQATVALLDTLTRCLDSGTWIEQLNVEANGEVRLAGYSRRASDLPAKLMECAGLEKAGFMGSVQADRSSGTERFTLVAQRRLSGAQP